MNRILTLAILIFLFGESFSQVNVITQSDKEFFDQIFSIGHNNVDTKGSYYLSDEWESADISLVKDSLKAESIPIRVDLKNNGIEIKHKGQIKFVGDYQLYSFKLRYSEETYVTNHTLNQQGPAGFYKLLYHGNARLLCHYSTVIKPGNKNVKFHAVDPQDEIIKVTNYYYFIDNELIKIETNKSKFKKQFENDATLSAYIADQKINPKKEEDLLRFITYLDTQR